MYVLLRRISFCIIHLKNIFTHGEVKLRHPQSTNLFIFFAIFHNWLLQSEMVKNFLMQNLHKLLVYDKLRI